MVVVLSVGVAIWMVIWGRAGTALSITILLHWPLIPILLWGFSDNLKGGLIAGLVGVVYAIILGLTGVTGSWTLTLWQLLVYGIFGLYPFKFMQIREARSRHFATLIEYKKGELETLQNKLGDIDGKCATIEKEVRNWSASKGAK